MKRKTANTWYLLSALALLILVSAAGLYQFWLQIQTSDLLDLSASLRLQATFAAGGIWIVGCVFAVIRVWQNGAEAALQDLDRALDRLSSLRPASLPLFFGLLVILPYLIMGRYSLHMGDTWPRLAIFLALTLLASAALRLWSPETNWPALLSLSLLGFGLSAFLAAFIPQVTSYPFSLGWSEISRYYNGSLYLSDRIYGFKTPLPHRDFTRYFMQSFPYLFPSLGLMAHRLWQAALRVGLSLLAAYTLGRRLTARKTGLLLFSLWGALFLRQGPVFYPMLVILICFFAFYDAKRFWRSTLLVVLVSAWAGLTRINWIPMPALIASLLYIMESPWEGKGFKYFLRYVWPTGFWLASGAAAAVAARWVYQANSGLPMHIFASDFSSDLLWYRLLPNVNYPPGVLTGVLAITAPLLLFAIFSTQRGAKSLHPMRILGIWGIVGGLFLGGTLVSAKIGGGANMHNMDVYLVVLWILAATLYYRKIAPETSAQPLAMPLSAWGLALIVAVPVFFHVFELRKFPQRDFENAQFYVNRIQDYIDEYAADGEEVLFVAERHLITFGLLENVTLVPEYEQLFLMEMAMGSNPIYLAEFQSDLESHRFALILTDIIIERYKEPQVEVFAEENNIYSENVVHYLACTYEPLVRFRELSLQLWVPRDVNTCE